MGQKSGAFTELQPTGGPNECRKGAGRPVTSGLAASASSHRAMTVTRSFRDARQDRRRMASARRTRKIWQALSMR